MAKEVNRICLNCAQCGSVVTRQGWYGDEWWHACKADGAERKTIETCENWEAANGINPKERTLSVK